MVMELSCASFRLYEKFERDDHLPKRPRKSKKVDFEYRRYYIEFSGNKYGFDIFSNHFRSSTIWAIQIQGLFTKIEN